MTSLESALTRLKNKELGVWFNHPDFKSLSGVLTEVQTEHLVIKSGGSMYYVPYSAIVAIRPS